MTSKTTIYGTAEDVANEIGLAPDEFFVLGEDEKIKMNDTLEDEFRNNMADYYISEWERRQQIRLLGTIVDSASPDDFREKVGSMMTELLESKENADFSRISAKYGDLAEIEAVTSFLRGRTN